MRAPEKHKIPYGRRLTTGYLRVILNNIRAMNFTSRLLPRALFSLALALGISLGNVGVARAADPAKPAAGTGRNSSSTTGDSVKRHLILHVEKMDRAAVEFEQAARAYQELIAAHGGDYAKALAAARPEVLKLVEALRAGYQAMDPFGYENVEGIVAGVASLNEFDTYLDAGVPKAEAAADKPAAPVTLKLANGETVDGEGCLFTHIIEPALWGTQPKWVVPIDLNGDGKIDPRESLPRAELIAAAGADVRKKIGELLAASRAWEPTTKDCFTAMVTMAPTFPGYFDDWKESRYAGGDKEASGKFTAVSRVSDMRAIMSSVGVLYEGVRPQVATKDPALARAIEGRFKDILAFVDRLAAREKRGQITAGEIEGLTVQAKEKADSLVPQIEQAAALLGIKLGDA